MAMGAPSLSRWIWPGYLTALAGVAAVSGVIAMVGTRVAIPNISMLYLIAVLAVASFFGSGPAVLASVAAFLAFNFLFVEPRYTFAVADPDEWVALLLFLLTAVVTGQLAAGQRQRAEEAGHREREIREREREVAVLYDVVRLMNEPDLHVALYAVAERLHRELQLSAVAIQIEAGSGLDIANPVTTGDPSAIARAASVAAIPSQMLLKGRGATANRRGAPGRWVGLVPPHPPSASRPVTDRVYQVPVRAGERRCGTIVLVRAPDAPRFSGEEDRLLSAVAAQLAAALERVRLRRDATEAEVLRRADELKTALMNAVSHDLRTPLSSIIASAGSLRQRDVPWTEEDRQEFAGAIEDEARRLNRIVGNLLDLSRVEAGNLRPEKRWYDLGALIDDVVGRLRPLTAAHRVVLDVPEQLPPVLLDYVEIDQVLSNLIENAVKYTPPGTEVLLTARCVEDAVEISVADRGYGIPATGLPYLFEPFYRACGPTQRPGGTGLGLAVAKGLVQAHGGKIWAENRPAGGARFRFTLPFATPDETAGHRHAIPVGVPDRSPGAT